MQYLNDIVDLMVTEEVENFDNSYIVTRVELEVVGCNGDAQLNRKYLACVMMITVEVEGEVYNDLLMMLL